MYIAIYTYICMCVYIYIYIVEVFKYTQLYRSCIIVMLLLWPVQYGRAGGFAHSVAAVAT